MVVSWAHSRCWSNIGFFFNRLFSFKLFDAAVIHSISLVKHLWKYSRVEEVTHHDHIATIQCRHKSSACVAVATLPKGQECQMLGVVPV